VGPSHDRDATRSPPFAPPIEHCPPGRPGLPFGREVRDTARCWLGADRPDRQSRRGRRGCGAYQSRYGAPAGDGAGGGPEHADGCSGRLGSHFGRTGQHDRRGARVRARVFDHRREHHLLPPDRCQRPLPAGHHPAPFGLADQLLRRDPLVPGQLCGAGHRPVHRLRAKGRGRRLPPERRQPVPPAGCGRAELEGVAGGRHRQMRHRIGWQLHQQHALPADRVLHHRQPPRQSAWPTTCPPELLPRVWPPSTPMLPPAR